MSKYDNESRPQMDIYTLVLRRDRQAIMHETTRSSFKHGPSERSTDVDLNSLLRWIAPVSLPFKRSMSQRRSQELLVRNKVEPGAIDPDQGEMETIWLGSGDLPLLFDNHLISFYSVSIYHSAVEQKGRQASLQPERLKRCARNQSHVPSEKMSHDVVAQSMGAFCL